MPTGVLRFRRNCNRTFPNGPRVVTGHGLDVESQARQAARPAGNAVETEASQAAALPQGVEAVAGANHLKPPTGVGVSLANDQHAPVGQHARRILHQSILRVAREQVQDVEQQDRLARRQCPAGHVDLFDGRRALERLPGAPGHTGPRLDAMQPKVKRRRRPGARPAALSPFVRGRRDQRQHQTLSASHVDQRAVRRQPPVSQDL